MTDNLSKRSLGGALAVSIALAGCAAEKGESDTDAPPRDAPLRIVDRLEDPPDGPFFAPVDVEVTDGRVWIVDVEAKRVYGYGFDGGYRLTLGREGAGPGELKQPLALSVARDTLWVLDPGNRRLQRFGTDGSDLGAARLPDSIPPLVDMVRLGGAFFATTPFGDRPLVKLARDGTPLALFGEELARESADLAAASGTVPAVYRLAVVDDELWAAHLYLPLLATFDAEGRLLRSVRYPAAHVEPEEEGPADREDRRREREPSPVGGVGVLCVDRAAYLLTHQRTAEGRQKMYDPNRPEGPVLLSPEGAVFVTSASVDDRAYVIGVRGEMDVPTVFVVEGTNRTGPGATASGTTDGGPRR